MASPVLLFTLVGYGLVSVVTILVFGADKRAAIKHRRRTPERTLHGLSLLGGWPGALLAMQLFRHKRRKSRFVWTVRGIAALHVAAWGCWAYLVFAQNA